MKTQHKFQDSNRASDLLNGCENWYFEQCGLLQGLHHARCLWLRCTTLPAKAPLTLKKKSLSKSNPVTGRYCVTTTRNFTKFRRLEVTPVLKLSTKIIAIWIPLPRGLANALLTILDACNMSHCHCSCITVRHRLERYDLPLLFQLPDKLAAKQPISKTRLIARVTPFKNIKMFPHQTPIQRQGNR